MLEVLKPHERAQVIHCQEADFKNLQLVESLIKERKILNEGQTRDAQLFEIREVTQGREIIYVLIACDVDSVEPFAWGEGGDVPERSVWLSKSTLEVEFFQHEQG